MHGVHTPKEKSIQLLWDSGAVSLPPWWSQEFQSETPRGAPPSRRGSRGHGSPVGGLSGCPSTMSVTVRLHLSDKTRPVGTNTVSRSATFITERLAVGLTSNQRKPKTNEQHGEISGGSWVRECLFSEGCSGFPGRLHASRAVILDAELCAMFSVSILGQ